ncbi:DUF1479-domain-containing protein [Meredithblackwellia eburnea MCA 4105]
MLSRTKCLPTPTCLNRFVHSTTKAAVALPAASRNRKSEGTIASVFATLSNPTEVPKLPQRFAQLKLGFVESAEHAEALKRGWVSVLSSLETEIQDIIDKGEKSIPTIEYPRGSTADNSESLAKWVDPEALREVKKRGAAVIKGVIDPEKALNWKRDLRKYIAANPGVKGFPENDKQVFELYWSKSQIEARANPDLLAVTKAFLALFHAPHMTRALPKGVEPLDLAISLSNPVVYADRLRIRHPGDSQFALGPHIDGGGVERWEDPYFKKVWSRILEGECDWTKHDPWSLGDHGERLMVNGDMYNGPGACSVFRPFQGWVSMSSTGRDEGTLRLLPLLREVSSYIALRPFFRPKVEEVPVPGTPYSKEYLSPENWIFDPTTSDFPGCSLGHNIELNKHTHPHLRLEESMTSVPKVAPGDVVLWHDNIIHAVESEHKGLGDSSVMYIPEVPLTKRNWSYVENQREDFLIGVPPSDFPGGVGEKGFVGRATQEDVQGIVARRAMGLDKFDVPEEAPELEKALVNFVNESL